MRVPDKALNTVGFIAHDTEDIKYGGTAFIAGVRGAHGNAYLHLVTAKHVAEEVGEGPFVIGLNLKSGKKVLVEADGVKWFYHPTEPNAVDAAVTIFAPSQYDLINVEWVFEEMFVSPEKINPLGIGVGDEVFVVGLFTRFSGQSKHFPIVRIGNIAMMPTDRIPVEKFDPMEAYLAEGRSIGGLSGSPVYVRQTVHIDLNHGKGEVLPFAGVGQIYFLGLMHGHWQVPSRYLKNESIEAAEAVNMGISIIVPAHKIKEIIYHPELVAMRKKFDEEIAAESGPVKDTGFDESKPKEPTFTKQDFEAALAKVTRKVGDQK